MSKIEGFMDTYFDEYKRPKLKWNKQSNFEILAAT